MCGSKSLSEARAQAIASRPRLRFRIKSVPAIAVRRYCDRQNSSATRSSSFVSFGRYTRHVPDYSFGFLKRQLAIASSSVTIRPHVLSALAVPYFYRRVLRTGGRGSKESKGQSDKAKKCEHSEHQHENHSSLVFVPDRFHRGSLIPVHCCSQHWNITRELLGRDRGGKILPLFVKAN